MPNDSLPLGAPPPDPEPAPGFQLRELRGEIDALRAEVDALMAKVDQLDHRDPVDGLHHGVAALESASAGALSVITPRGWVDEGKRWIRDVPIISVIGSIAFGWTLASVVRR